MARAGAEPDAGPTRSGRRSVRTVLTAVAIAAALLLVPACGSDSSAEPTPTARPGSEGATSSTRPADSGPTGPGSVEANATVERVVDGDTLVVDIDGSRERVRLIGIDTPESVKPNSPVECFGKEASAHAAELLPDGTPVRLVLDVEERDRYDRVLAYVYRADDGLFVNLAMATDGYAGVLTYPPNVAHTDQFRAAVADARSAGRGLWAACASDLPVESR